MTDTNLVGAGHAFLNVAGYFLYQNREEARGRARRSHGRTLFPGIIEAHLGCSKRTVRKSFECNKCSVTLHCAPYTRSTCSTVFRGRLVRQVLRGAARDFD